MCRLARTLAQRSLGQKVIYSTCIGCSVLLSCPAIEGEGSELKFLAESEESMNSWIKALSAARVACWNRPDSLTGIREAQPDLVVKFMPLILRVLFNHMCNPDEAVNSKEKEAAFEALLIVCSTVESGKE